MFLTLLPLRVSLPTNFIHTLHYVACTYYLSHLFIQSSVQNFLYLCIIIHLISIPSIIQASNPQFREVILDPSQAILDGSPVIIFMFLLYFGIALLLHQNYLLRVDWPSPPDCELYLG